MANGLKNYWSVILLFAAGSVVFLFAFVQKKPQLQHLTMQEILTQDQKIAPGMEVAIAAAPEKSDAQDPVPSPAIIADPEHGQETSFAIQVYSFQDKDRAEKALENLKQNGYPQAYIIISDLGEKGMWYRVRVGGIDSEEKAHVQLEELRKNYNSGFIVKPK